MTRKAEPPSPGARPERQTMTNMTIDEFKQFAPRIVSEDVSRPSIMQPCRNGCHAYATDGRIALIFETCDQSFKLDDEVDARNVTTHLNNYIIEFNTAITRGKCEAFCLDAALLRIAARATFDNLAPSLDYLRTYEPDPDDPDDVPATETVRFVYERYSRVILPDRGRTVIAGYYADIIADILAATDTSCAYVRHDIKNSPIFTQGKYWCLILMPLRATHDFGEARWMDASAIADAATGELLHGYNIDEPDRADLDALRFPKKGGAK